MMIRLCDRCRKQIEYSSERRLSIRNTTLLGPGLEIDFCQECFEWIQHAIPKLKETIELTKQKREQRERKYAEERNKQ